jgi:hypothetical protein
MEKKQFVKAGNHIINIQAIAFIEHHQGGLVLVFSAGSDKDRLSVSIPDPLAQGFLDALDAHDFTPDKAG